MEAFAVADTAKAVGMRSRTGYGKLLLNTHTHTQSLSFNVVSVASVDGSGGTRYDVTTTKAVKQ